MLNEEYIVRQAIDGSQAAFAQIYDAYFDTIYRYVYFRVKNQGEAEDLTQEVFIKALNGISSYKVGKTPFASWLFRIAHNQVIDYVRKTGKQKMTALEEAYTVAGNEDPVATIEHKSELEELSVAIAGLPPAQQEVISLRFIAGLPIADVARILGKSEGTVKAQQFNATVALRKLIVRNT